LQGAIRAAQFFAMSDDTRLPALVRPDGMPASWSQQRRVTIPADATQLVAAPLEYDSIVIDTLTAMFAQEAAP